MSVWKETEIGRIPVSWEIGTLGEISKILTDGSHLSPKHVDSDCYMASVKDMRYNCFDFSDCKTISNIDFDKLIRNNCSPEFGDIILSKDGANCLDLIFVYKQKNKIVLLSSIAIARLKEEYDPDFYRYFLLSPNIQDLMRNNYVSGSAIPRVILKDFKNVPVPLLPLFEQKAIASILSSLDDKIDLLHQQNKTLEAMAETLFRQWFVEEAKEDWEIKQLKEVTDIGIGRTPPRKESQWFSTNPDDVKWISIKDLGDDGVFISNVSEYLTNEAVVKFNIPKIPKHTVVLSFKMTLGRVAITSEEMLSNEAIAHFKFNENTPFTKEFLYLFLKTFKYDSLGSTSSIVTSINSAMIKELEVVIPDSEIMNLFKNLTEPIFNKINKNQVQIQTLTSLRDTLLPKLMSGEIKVEMN